MTSKPQLKITTSPLTADGFPYNYNTVYKDIIDNAVSGGEGTQYYLQHVGKFADFASYLQKKGDAAYHYEDGPNGSKQTTATDGQTTLRINLQLAGPNDTPLYAAAHDTMPPPVHGLATIQLQLPAPESINKIINLAVGLAELPPGIAAGKALIDALFKPILKKLANMFQKCLDNWADMELDGDLDAAGDAISDAAADAADSVGEDAAEIVVEDVAADALIDLSAVAPPLAILGAVIAIPFIVGALEKKFILHFEVDNFTDYDVVWKVEYVDEGSMTSQPKETTIPKLGKATDIWGDETTVSVAYQANYSSMNKSGFTGIGLVLHLTPQNAGPETDIAAVISIPWIADNVLWLGDVPAKPDWQQIYDNAARSDAKITVEHTNLKFYTRLAINALSGNHDEYYCVIRLEAL